MREDMQSENAEYPPSNTLPVLHYCSKSTMETPEQRVKPVQS